jgi:hypothetical protein
VSHPLLCTQLKFILTLSLAAACLLLNSNVVAQQRGRTPRARTLATQPDDASRLRRARAVALLNETADAARGLDDFLYRARLQALAAETLLPFDAPRSRILFVRAWEAATLADKEQQQSDQNKDANVSNVAKSINTEARDEILSKVAARDSSLTEKFLNELRHEEADESESRGNQPSRATPSREMSASGLRRLALAYQLLDRGENVQASQLVVPLLNEGVNANLVLFLLRLREQDAVVGNALYRLLIEATRRDVNADSNSVLLLSTPIVSPELLVLVDAQGSLQFRPIPRAAMPQND